MSPESRPARRVMTFRGISFRIARMAWMVTLATLAVFLAVTLPEQKREFELNLESKARGVVASLKGEVAAAAITEDYSAVVDQSMQVLQGDDAVDFVVITRNDGYSLAVDRKSWRIEMLDRPWRGADRVVSTTIGTVDLFRRRAFHYSTPFDYSGLKWGWIHVGLNLDAYDQSLWRSYLRTGLVALFCVAMSLGIALYYSNRLVRPIDTLHCAVEKVAKGDLHARAVVHTRDEIMSLAEAFNSMTATLLLRDRTLESVAHAAQALLSASEWTVVIEDVLRNCGLALGATRAYVCRSAGFDASRALEPLFEWTALGGPAAIDKPNAGSHFSLPILVGDEWWGFLGFDDALHRREWGDAEKDCLRVIARMLGASIARQRAQRDLIEAKNTLESRVVERTRELRAEVAAKAKANAELASAQERLLALSRHAGMAEVATGVLHNVGNVLNSVNVSAQLVSDRLRQSRIDRLPPLVGLLDEHGGDLPRFLAADPKGTQLFPYLKRLSDHLVRERDELISELTGLTNHVGHVKEIVAAQQGYATTAGFVEEVAMQEIVEHALTIAGDGLTRGGITVIRHYEKLPAVSTDRHKVLQILLNLLRNARDAAVASGKDGREIHVRLRPSGESHFEIEVSDNGVGLRPQDIARVFQHGFTTKKNGHGFGLHSSAIAAGELSGQITVSSEGPGKGASFVVRLPLKLGSSEEVIQRQ